MKRWIVRTLATFFYLGYSPFAPGTVGTVGAVVLFYLLSHFSLLVYIPYYSHFSHTVYYPLMHTAHQRILLEILLLLVFIIFSVWVSGEAEVIFGKTDPGQVVIDEVCGYLVTMFLISPSLRNIILGFFLFRFFDVIKSPPARRSERLPGGFGIVIDDVIAGIYSNIILQFVTRVIG